MVDNYNIGIDNIIRQKKKNANFESLSSIHFYNSMVRFRFEIIRQSSVRV